MKFLMTILICAATLKAGVLSSDNGRYIFGKTSDMRADQFMLDTKTGRLWQMVADKDGQLKLSAIAVENVEFFNGKPNFSISNKPIDK